MSKLGDYLIEIRIKEGVETLKELASQIDTEHEDSFIPDDTSCCRRFRIS